MLVGDILARRAQAAPDRIALVEYPNRRHYSYAELHMRANRLANFLAARLGVAKGDRVSILAQNSAVYVDLLFGLARLGALFVPLNWRLTARELAGIVQDCQPKVVLCGPHYAPTLLAVRQQAAIGRVVALDGATIEDGIPYEQGIEEASTEEFRPPDDMQPEDPAAILYTSGTTGRPKGAIIPHRMVHWNCVNTVVSWELTESDISPVFTPLFHSGGLFAFLTPLFSIGGRIILAPLFDAEESLKIIVRECCTVILGVPSLFQIWMNSPALPRSDFHNVRWFISGGAPCPIPLMKSWRENTDTVLRQGYGLTEAGVNCFTMTNEESVTKAGSVGQPIAQTRMRVVDNDGKDVDIDTPGELLIAGPNVFSGYWRNPEATGLALRDGWLHTGDMVKRDSEGFTTIIGRYKDMIISGGENVYAAEVESVFREHPAVADAALIGEPDPTWGETGVMVVVLKNAQQCSADALLAFCSDRLARFKIPKRVVFTAALPVSPYGKVEKTELQRLYIHIGRSDT